MKKYVVFGLSLITFGSVLLPSTISFADSINESTESSELINTDGFTVRSEDITPEMIEQMNSVTATDVINLAKQLGYAPEDVWTKEELKSALQSDRTRAGTNRMITMSNDLKYLYMSSFTAKLAITAGGAAISALFPGIGTSILGAAIGLIISENINLDNGIIVRLSRNSSTHILIPTAVWSQ